MLKLIFQDSITGKRESNQDSYLYKELDNETIIVAVADGMGGGIKGEEASKLAIDILDREITKPLEYPLIHLKNIIFTINNEVKLLLDGEKGGTTLSVAYYNSGKIYYLSIGDSRVWICRDNKVLYLSKDQNLYEFNILKNKKASLDDKRLIFRVIGISSNKEIEAILEDKAWFASGVFEMQKDDILLLSSDGFHDYVVNPCLDLEISFDIARDISNDNITLIALKEE